MVQITYQKRDGCIIQRLRNTMIPYKIGETTSMGWKVLKIEYAYKDKFYPEYEYNMIISKKKQKCVRINNAKKMYMNHLINLLYYCAAVGVINLLKYILGK